MSSRIQASRKSERIKIKLSEIMLREMVDPSLKFVSITRLTVDANASIADIYFSGMQGEPAELTEKLTAVAPYLRKRLGQCLRYRNTPELRFHYDGGFDYADNVDAILQEIATS